jgi:hypothetical protein
VRLRTRSDRPTCRREIENPRRRGRRGAGECLAKQPDKVFAGRCRRSGSACRLSALPRQQLGAPPFVGPLRCSAEEFVHALRECFRLTHRQVVVGLELCPARVRNPADELVRELEPA